MLGEARTTVAVAAPTPAIGTSPAAPRPRPAQQAVPQLNDEARKHALRLVRKSDEQLAEGGSPRRIPLQERATDTGLAAGEMAVATT